MTNTRTLSGPTTSHPEVIDRRPTRTASPRWVAVQGKSVEFISQALLVLALPRLLGPAEFGRLTVGITIVTLGSVAISLGAPSAVARFLPAEPAAQRAGLARTITLRLVRVRCIQLAIAGTIAAILTLAVPERFDPRDTALVFLALALDVAAMLGAQIALGVGRTWIWSFRLAAKNIGLLVFVPLLFHLYGPPGVLEGLLLSSVAGMLVPGWTGFNFVRQAEHGVPIPKGAMRYGMVAGMSNLVGQLTYRGPVVATTILTGSATETGFAALAAGIGLAIMFAVRELFTVSLPELVQHWGRDRDEAERALRRIGWRAEAVLIPVAFIGVLLLGRGVPLVAGRQFTPAIGALVPIMMLLPILPLPIIGYQGAALRLRPEIALATEVVGVLSFTLAVLLLVPKWGALGATTGLLVAVITASVLMLWRLRSAVTPRLWLAAALGSAGTLGIAVALGAGR